MSFRLEKVKLDSWQDKAEIPVASLENKTKKNTGISGDRVWTL